MGEKVKNHKDTLIQRALYPLKPKQFFGFTFGQEMKGETIRTFIELEDGRRINLTDSELFELWNTLDNGYNLWRKSNFVSHCLTAQIEEMRINRLRTFFMEKLANETKNFA